MSGDARAAGRGWRLAYWLLLAMFVLTAALNLLEVRGGFLTNHAADLLLPPWLFIVLRGLAGTRPSRFGFLRWLGSTPELAAGALFIASAATELSQRAWPHGWFAGTFDPLDIVAFAVGLLICYGFDKRRGGQSGVPGSRVGSALLRR